MYSYIESIRDQTARSLWSLHNVIAGEGRWPRVLGLTDAFPPEGCDPYF